MYKPNVKEIWVEGRVVGSMNGDGVFIQLRKVLARTRCA